MKLLILGSKEYPLGANTDDPMPSGGIEVYTENLVKELQKYEIDIKLISRRFRGIPPHENEGNLDVFRVPWLNGFVLRNPTFNLCAFLKALTLDFDVILGNGPVASFFGLILSRFKNARILIRPAGVAFVQPQYNNPLKRLLYRLERFVYSRGDVIIFLSKEEKNEFYRKLGFLPEKYVIIPTGVNVSDFRISKSMKIVEEFGLNGKTVITFVGRLIETKGVKYLIEAIDLLKENDIKVIIVGSGPDLKRHKDQARSMNLQEKVVFAGFRRDISEILSVTDIFVLPSLSEGLPIALLEAMASGCACVVTDIGLPVKDMENGLVVPSKDPAGMAKGINKLLDDSLLRKDIGSNARAYIEINHSWHKAAKSYMQLFQDLRK
jgi:glycosyltransferase involved in cell wall biosynthesis